MNDSLLVPQSGVIDNGVARSIQQYLDPSKKVYGFGWGNIDAEMVGQVLTPKLDKSTIGSYLDAKGQPEVLDLVVDFVNKRSKHKVSRDQVLLTNGATNGIALLVHYFRNVHDAKTVLAQSPVYDTALNIFRSNGLIIRDVQEKEVERGDSLFAYLIFKLHNPTGQTMRPAEKKKLISEVMSSGRYLVEDDSYGLLDDDEIDLVNDPHYIYVGSFSKYIFPGLRMGFIIADPRVVTDLAIRQKYLTAHPNIISQMTLAEYLRTNQIDTSLAGKRKILAEKRTEFDRGLEGTALSQYLRSSGGFYYWFELPAYANERALFEDLLRSGVITIPGQIYFFNNPCPSLRVSVSQIAKKDIVPGIGIIDEVLRRHV